jgi:hypothetical protein
MKRMRIVFPEGLSDKEIHRFACRIDGGIRDTPHSLDESLYKDDSDHPWFIRLKAKLALVIWSWNPSASTQTGSMGNLPENILT